MEKPFLITHTFTINVAYINHGTVGRINVFFKVSNILVKTDLSSSELSLYMICLQEDWQSKLLGYIFQEFFF